MDLSIAAPPQRFQLLSRQAIRHSWEAATRVGALALERRGSRAAADEVLQRETQMNSPETDLWHV